MPVIVRLPQTLTAFACPVDESGRVLLLLHERLGVRRWELPGGHVEIGESIEQAAERETVEEAGVGVRCGGVIAEGVHHWRGRTVAMVFLRASPTSHDVPTTPAEPAIHSVGWFDLHDLDLAAVSPLAAPVVARLRDEPAETRLRFEATHHRTPAGWEPVVTRRWTSAVCQA